MLREGRLIWSRNRKTGTWWVWGHADESHMYVATRAEGGGWVVELRRGRADTLADLGWHRTLREAKRAADIDHHARALDGDNEGLKGYLRRYPIKEK